MNDIKSITISIVITTIVIGIIELLLPNNNFKNQMRLITGTIILISLISPFTNDFNDFEFDISGYENKNTTLKSNEKAVASSLKYEITKLIKENGINDGKIIIDTETENSSIIIRKVYILLYKNDINKSKKIKKQIYNKLKINVKIGAYNE